MKKVIIIIIILVIRPCLSTINPIENDIQQSTLKIILNKLAHNDSWGLNTIEVGFNGPIVSKAIIKTYRSVRPNLNPKANDEKYIVEDIIKIGYRLGAQLVVAGGDISFVKTYRLIYPVKSKLEGTWNNKFILNLLLPYHVHKNQLPEKYILLTEESIEGRGRLIISPQLFIPIGIGISLSKIELSRIVIAKKNQNNAKILIDNSRSSKLNTELLLKLPIMNFSILNSSNENGELRRKFFKIKINSRKNNLNFIINNTIKNNDITPLFKYGVQKNITNNFHAKETLIEFFGLFSLGLNFNKDKFIIEDENSSTVYKETISYRKLSDWWLPRSGETKLLTITYNGIVSDNLKISNPIYNINIYFIDNRTKRKEMEYGYLNFFNSLSTKKLTINENLFLKKNIIGKTFGAFKFSINQQGLNQMLEQSDQKYWKILSQVINKPMMNKQSYRLSILRGNGQIKIKHLINKMKQFLRYKNFASSNLHSSTNQKNIFKMLKKIFFIKKYLYSPVIMKVIKKIVTSENTYQESSLFIKGKTEHLINSKSGTLFIKNNIFENFHFMDTQELYNSL